MAQDASDDRGVLGPRGVTLAGMGANVALAAAKIAAGIAFASQAILADGFHSASDLVTDVAVLAGLGRSGRPADYDHPYGHRRISTLVALFVGAALLVTAVGIAYNGIAALRRPGDGSVRPLVPLVVAVASVVIKEGLFRLTRRVGRRAGDLSLRANAWHHRTDAFSSLAAAAGLAGVLAGGPRWHFLDATTAVVLATFVALAAVRIVRESAAELVDRAPDPATRAAIRRAIAATEGVQSFHACRARHVGGDIDMDVHVQVCPTLSVAAGHDIATRVRDEVQAADPRVIQVIVHVEPGEADARGE